MYGTCREGQGQCRPAQGAQAQQFQEQAGVLPVPTDYWTEGVTALDANEDGRWDVLFVHANGWAKPGDFHATGTFPLPPILLVNQGTVGGNPGFVDESATYLPAGLEIHGKGASVGDFDADGHDDLVLAVVFGGPQRLLMKQPDSLAWVDESTRLPEMHINCFSAGVGDLDDDGDLDLVFTDAGRPPFSPPGGKARLCINDGEARFTFDDQLIPPADVYTYETEWGDLDNDDDIDGILMSMVFATEGSLQNFLEDSGALSFRGTTETMVGLPVGEVEDDNEFVFLDADDDGDLDVINVSLQSLQEKLYVNRGTFGPAFLEFIPDAGFSKVTDSSLDMAVADFDGDGDYDAVTGQGESFDFTDRYYRNQGPADTQPPRIGRIEGGDVTVSLDALASGGLVRHAWIQDSTWDDGQTFVTAELLFETRDGGGTGWGSVPMQHSGGQVFRGVLRLPPCPTGQVGTRVGYRVLARDANGNTSVSGSQSLVVCGSERLGPQGSMTLDASAEPTLGAGLALRVRGGPPGRPGVLLLWSRADRAGLRGARPRPASARPPSGPHRARGGIQRARGRPLRAMKAMRLGAVPA
jgi:hypothetical protein